MSRTDPSPIHAGSQYRRSRWRLLVPVLVLLAAGALLLKDVSPAFDSGVERILDHAQWRATEACVQAALASIPQAAEARLRYRGRTHALAGGYLTQDVRILETEAGGGTLRVTVSCRINAQGRITEIRRELDPAREE